MDKIVLKNESKKDLYMADSLENLEKLVQDELKLSNIKRYKAQNLPPVLKKLKQSIEKDKNDEELCFLLCKRYIALMDFLMKFHEDPLYINALYSTDYAYVKKLMEEAEASLRIRYAVTQISNENLKTGITKKLPPVTVAEGVVPDKNDPSFFDCIDDIFITAEELYRALKLSLNVLIIDTRLPSEFDTCSIKVEGPMSSLINIPRTVIQKGLSAEMLGKKLDPETSRVWVNRTKFEAVVMFDHDTTPFDYARSFLQILRNIMAEWDPNSDYRRKPFILQGGIKEFIEHYPGEVTDAPSYMRKHKYTEFDDLINIEDYIYPECGTTDLSIKIYSIKSVDHLEFRSTLFGDDDRKEEEVELPAKKPRVTDDEKDLIEKAKNDMLKEARATKPKTFSADVTTDKKELENNYPAAIVSSMVDILAGGDQIPSTASPKKPEAPALDRTLKPTRKMSVELECPGFGYTGLINNHNICYMNSMIQSLKVIPPLKKIYVLSNVYETRASGNELNFHFAEAMQDCWKGTPDKPHISYLGSFRDQLIQLNPVYGRGQHEDAFELFTFLFEVLSNDTTFTMKDDPTARGSRRAWFTSRGGRSSIWADLCFHQVRCRRSCRNCKNITYQYEHEPTLMLPVTEHSTTLQDLIKNFLKEGLPPDFACTMCHTLGSILMYRDIAIEPELLVIVLKRYRVVNGLSRKLNTSINFPLEGLSFGQGKYKLYAIVEHMGSTNSGHYTTTVLLDDQQDTWVNFNDTLVTPIPREYVIDSKLKSGCAGLLYVKTVKEK